MRGITACALTFVVLLSGTASAAAEPTPRLSDPLVVVDNFLAARNARDTWGAMVYCADLLAIDTGDDRWTVDAAAANASLQRLTDEYSIDTLVHPRADGERVTWTERLVPRGLPFKDALASSTEVRVEVAVHDGRIISYSARYPVGVFRPVSRPAAADPSAGVAGPSVGVLFLVAGLAVVAILLFVGVSSAMLRGRRSD